MTSADCIQVDHNHLDCSTLVTSDWLSFVLGEPDEATNEAINALGLDEVYDWAERDRLVLEALRKATARADLEVLHSGYTGNSENSLSGDFGYQVFGDPDADPFWSHDLVIVVDGSSYLSDCPAQAGFFDWTIGYSVTYASDDEPIEDNDRLSPSYSSWPHGELERLGVKPVGYSERHAVWLGWHNGRPVKIHPEYYVEGA